VRTDGRRFRLDPGETGYSADRSRSFNGGGVSVNTRTIAIIALIIAVIVVIILLT
jgi:hypothetical protein